MDYYSILSTIFKYIIVIVIFLFIKNILKDILYYMDHESKGKKFKIIIPDINKQVKLKDNLSIGRASDNDIVIRDALISKRHIQIIKKGDSYLLKDLKSANGTYLNNSMVKNAYLKTGDRILIGKTLILFEEIEDE